MQTTTSPVGFRVKGFRAPFFEASFGAKKEPTQSHLGSSFFRNVLSSCTRQPLGLGSESPGEAKSREVYATGNGRHQSNTSLAACAPPSKSFPLNFPSGPVHAQSIAARAKVCSEPSLPGPDPWFQLEDDLQELDQMCQSRAMPRLMPGRGDLESRLESGLCREWEVVGVRSQRSSCAGHPRSLPSESRIQFCASEHSRQETRIVGLNLGISARRQSDPA